ncbi:hypothetical protein PHLCEN_2v12646 [Hermanssonia centrifuga]|uniref:Uncharacterized protein n=1 Tax=Hermanssonia centrifuga TaxID=98765 RepID=A0A2R6NGK7_9APHY|nr:hypothetical protein PHLCEN_2v12646 [Hermanssonia centrifuga]
MGYNREHATRHSLRCLRSTQPSACPLCRKAFVPDRIKKIHVDRYTPGDEDEVNEFLRRIALLSGENVEAEDVMKLTHEIHNWLATPEGENSETFAKAEQSIAEKDSELSQLRTEHAFFRAEIARYHGTSNPLPPPPQSVSTNRISFARPLTSMSRKSAYSAIGHTTGTNGGRSGMTRVFSEPSVPRDISQYVPPIPEDPTEESSSRRKRTNRPVMVPGASPSKKVVPPPASDNTRIHAYRPDTRTPRAEVLHDQSSFIDPTDDSTPRTRGASLTLGIPEYGYIPGVGYVPSTQPWSPQPLNEELEETVGELRLYSQQDASSDIQRGDRRTIEAAARALAVSSGEIETNESTWGHVRSALASSFARNNDSSSSIVTVATQQTANGASNSNSTSASLSNLRLLAAPTAAIDATQDAGGSVFQRDSRNVSITSSPSSASTWGTVSSAGNSRYSSLGNLHLTGLPTAPSDMDLASDPSSSHNSSMAHLHLTGLPNMSMDRLSSASASVRYERPERASNSGEALGTPRGSPWNPASSPQFANTRQGTLLRDGQAIGSVQSSYLQGDAIDGAGLGLMLPNTQVTEQENLDQVDESLMRLLREERTRSRYRRHSRQSMSDTEAFSRLYSTPGHDRNNASDSRSVNQQLAPSNGTTTADRDFGPHSSARGSDSDLHHQSHNSVPSGVSASSRNEETRSRRSDLVSHARRRPSDTSYSSPHGSQSPRTPAALSAIERSISGESSSSALSGALLLSFVPSGPTTAATTARGSPSAIRAPRPVSSRQASNIFGRWNSEHTRDE